MARKDNPSFGNNGSGKAKAVKRGRPSDYSEEVSSELLARISTGEPLMAICRDEHMPAWRTVYDWRDAHPSFSAGFARAREIGGDAIAFDALSIADDLTDDPASRRVRVETRLKLLAKWFPKQYGDRVSTEVSGPNGGPLQMDVATRSARVAQLLAIAMQRKQEESAGDQG